MDLALAATWNPRGEMLRFERLLPQLEQVYSSIVISFPPQAESGQVSVFKEGRFSAKPNLMVTFNHDWSWGRFVALKEALSTSASHVHYADMDRLLRWVEKRPEEWRVAVETIYEGDCLIMGRSESAYATHPKAMIRTEVLSNRVISFLVGKEIDVSAGSKGFSRKATQFLVSATEPGKAMGTDGEWTVLLHRAGFKIDYLEVEGLDWESADRYRDQAAEAEDQKRAAEAYDADPTNWEIRLHVAKEIIEAGLKAMERKLEAPS